MGKKKPFSKAFSIFASLDRIEWNRERVRQ
jgi:hypothetical protein